MQTSQKHAKLKTLAKQTAKNIYDMLRLADQILHDAEYVDQFGGEADLIDMMEADEFVHFGGNPSLPAMLRAFRTNPERARWEEYKYNIRAMIDLAVPGREAEAAERVNWKALSKQLQAELEQAKAAIEEYRHTNGELRAKCEDQIATIGEMRGRIAVLEEIRGIGAIAHG